MQPLTAKQLHALKMFHTAAMQYSEGGVRAEVAESYVCSAANCTSSVFRILAERGLLTRIDRRQRGLHNVLRYRLTLAGRCVLGLPLDVSYSDLQELAAARANEPSRLFAQAITAELVNGELVLRIPFTLPAAPAQEEKAQVAP